MKLRKIFCLAVISVIVSAGIASALSLGELLPTSKPAETTQPAPKVAEVFPENTFIARQDDSVYFVLKLDDTASFLKWIASEENINLFMPLILKSEDSSDIIGGIEFFRAFAEKTPLKSAAIIVGMPNPDSKKQPFFQMAFTVDASMAETVRKISDGTAEDSDFAKLILGNDNPIAAIAQTMIKAEKLKDGGYRIDNEVFLKAEGDMLILAMNAEELEAALAARKGEGRLFGHVKRQFTEKDFMLIHVDYATLDKLDTDKNLDDADGIVNEFFDKPLNFELAFESLPEKFVLSFAVNLVEAVKKEYAAKMKTPVTPVKGSYISLSGTKNPLLALGGHLTLSVLKDSKETKKDWDEFARQLRVRFGISEEDTASFFDGAFSLTVNDSVTFEGFKIPAIYISQKGLKGAAGKIFEKLTKSPHFQKVQEGILQLDSSLSPISCLIQNKGETLGINFAELASLNGTPTVKPVLQSLLDAEGISALWIDFDEIRAWLTDAENGVMAMAIPMAKFAGYGEIADAVNEILTAEFSVPSFSFRAENVGKFRFEFANVKINAENGIIARAIKIYQKFSK
ncbi:MAG: hypothetical protein IJL18_00655 [Synergistaceae bacterium]|nr:hypothetical protein [Synergistaceae bacterium]